MTTGIPPAPSDNEHLWRYLTLNKFRSLIETQALFFAHVSAFEDRFEGAFPDTQPPTIRALNMLGARDMTGLAQVNLSPELHSAWQLARRWAVVSCWHHSRHESVAMWKQYAGEQRSVAVQTSVGRLRNALGSPPAVPDGFFGSPAYEIGAVEYIDFASGYIHPGNLNAQFFRKRLEYRSEQEVRVLLTRFPLGPDRTIDPVREPTGNGQCFAVNLEMLIERVVVAPNADDSYVADITQLLAKHVPIARVERSSLDRIPNY